MKTINFPQIFVFIFTESTENQESFRKCILLNPFNTEWNSPFIVLGQLKSSVGLKGLMTSVKATHLQEALLKNMFYECVV